MLVYLCLGSNMDDPMKQITIAREKITEVCGLGLLRQSSVKRTAAYGYTLQEDFYNQILELECNLEPMTLLSKIQEIEITSGRKPTFKWGPRVIDIDIIFYGRQIVNSCNLVVPHPDIQNRIFVLQLLDELIPDYIHPVLLQSVNELYTILKKTGGSK